MSASPPTLASPALARKESPDKEMGPVARSVPAAAATTTLGASAQPIVDKSIDDNAPVSPMSALRLSSSPVTEAVSQSKPEHSSNIGSEKTPSNNQPASSSSPKLTTTPKKTVKFSETTQTHTLPPPPSQPLQKPNATVASTHITMWDTKNKAQPLTAPQNILVPDGDEIFIFDDDDNMPISIASKFASAAGADETSDRPKDAPVDDESDNDDENDGDLDSEGRDHVTPLRETFVSHSYVQALNIPLPPDHPDYGSSLANTPGAAATETANADHSASVSKSFVSGSLGSYKGRPLMMPILRDPSVQERVQALGQVNSFVGGLDGRSGVDESDFQSYRASLATGSYGGGLGSLRMDGGNGSVGGGLDALSYSGTPRSFTDHSPPLTGAEWTRKKREDFLVKRQQERQIRESSRAQKKAPVA
ncbi:hypothetical protein CFO_g1700 [Ceratocystis platani]|uniref:Uncharacterized protein n=1 Tax=Ceratocystis fimbriata f. sp. platani TaxID=88771 RepID=A0A0F8B347_CERFI|nr:hypothetical protein CFO_g1700 [Ceratocystis platani]